MKDVAKIIILMALGVFDCSVLINLGVMLLTEIEDSGICETIVIWVFGTFGTIMLVILLIAIVASIVDIIRNLLC